MNPIIISPNIQVIASGLNFPEGPVFDIEGNLWVVELKGGCISRLVNNELVRTQASGAPNGMTIDKQNRLWICDSFQNSIRRYTINSGHWDTIVDKVDGLALNKPNDLAFDSRGNILFTCPGNSRAEPTGYVCMATPDRVVKKIATDMYYPNGLAFTENGRTLIIAETYKHRLWKGDWDPINYKLTEFNPWVHVGGPIGPDGMAFDERGNLYVAVFDKKCIKKISFDGRIIDVIELPGNRPTNCAFEPGKKNLVITEAANGELLKLETEFSGAKLLEGSVSWD